MVTIVADRIGEPDAKNGFILDGFPRTVPQAVALDKMLKEKGLKLDGVIELKVDGSILQSRIENRMREAAARGEPLRSDDDPEVLKRRVDAYREQTAPLVDYYRWQGTPEVGGRHARDRRGRGGYPQGADREAADPQAGAQGTKSCQGVRPQASVGRRPRAAAAETRGHG